MTRRKFHSGLKEGDARRCIEAACARALYDCDWLILLFFVCCRAAKDCILRLLDKDERTRLGSRSGASEVKQHKWFGKVNWGLLRNSRPPVSGRPWTGKTGLLVNRCLLWQILPPTLCEGTESGPLRHLKESNSLHLEEQIGPGSKIGKGHSEDGVDLFGAFSSVTLHYDGDI